MEGAVGHPDSTCPLTPPDSPAKVFHLTLPNSNPVSNPMNMLSIIVTCTIHDGSLTDNPEESRIVTRRMARNRAVALAVMNGRPPQEVSKADWEQAKLELTEKSVK